VAPAAPLPCTLIHCKESSTMRSHRRAEIHKLPRQIAVRNGVPSFRSYGDNQKSVGISAVMSRAD